MMLEFKRSVCPHNCPDTCGLLAGVENGRGECHVSARVTRRAAPGLTVMEGLYWPRFMSKNLGINQLTSQRLTDMGGGCAFHCNLVEVSPSAT